ncbi:MAG: pyridoxamine 5'-phosphate oxidase family protein [Candidatus Omnitrophota bacterium]
MKKLSDNIINFFQSEGFVIVSTIDQKGHPHNSCKGIIKMNRNGRVYLLDLYRKRTYENLRQNPQMSITLVDEHKFIGFSLKGKGKIVLDGDLQSEIIKAWEDKITSRLTKRLLKNIHEEKGHARHPEVHLPRPEYLITMEVEEIIDLTPHHLK